jgi:hypothetical protein
LSRLAAFIAARFATRTDKAPGLWFSAAGEECPRRVYYHMTSAERAEETLERKLVMAFGSAFDEYALRAIDGMAVQMPVRLEVGPVTVTGRADAVFLDAEGKPEHVADLKLVGASTWAKVAKGPKKEHRAQVNLYAYALEAATWSVCYVLREASGDDAAGTIREYDGASDAFAARRDVGMFEEVAYWLAKGEAPPRPYADIEDDETGRVTVARDAFPCGWCPYRSTCWGLT